MFLSAINALTLSPALCGVLLRPHHGPRRGVIGMVMRSIDSRARRLRGRGRPHRALLGHRTRAGRGCGGRASSVWPRSRRPASCPRTTRARCSSSSNCRAAHRWCGPPRSSARRRPSCKEEPAVADYTSVIGLNFIDNYSQSNAAFMVVTLKPFEERKDASLGAPQVIARLGAEVPPDPGRHRRSAGAAADRRSRHRRRLHLCAGGSARRRSRRRWRRCCAG